MTGRTQPPGICVVASDRASALRPRGQQIPDAASGRGTTESLAAQQNLIDRCGRLNPDAATGFEEYSAQFVKDTPEPEVVELHASAAYNPKPKADETTLAAPGPEG